MVPLCRIQRVQTPYTPAEVWRIFQSGAAVGYLDPTAYPPVSFTSTYAERFSYLLQERRLRRKPDPTGWSRWSFIASTWSLSDPKSIRFCGVVLSRRPVSGGVRPVKAIPFSYGTRTKKR